MKKKLLLSGFALLLLCEILTACSNRINYETPIPLGVEVDLVSGLTPEEEKIAIENYAKRSSTDWRQKVRNIDYNFRQSIDEEKYYGGCYYEGDKKETRHDTEEAQHFYILVTDIDIVPKELKKVEKLHFKEVKYSEAELFKFIGIIEEKFLYTGLSSIGRDVKNNKIEIAFLEDFDIKQLDGVIPEDSYAYTFVKERDAATGA